MARLFTSRRPVPPQAAPQTATKTFPAPAGGWQTNKNLAMDGPMTARLLDNWFPTRTGIRCRGDAVQARVGVAGALRHAGADRIAEPAHRALRACG